MGELHNFASLGNLNAIKKALASKSKSFFEKDEEKGWTPLHYAANSSKTRVVQVILDAGIDPNISSNPPAVKKINAWNCSLEVDEAKTPPVLNPMDVADGPNIKKIILLLSQAGGSFHNKELTLHQAVQLADINEIEALLEDDSIRINGRDDRGWMAIHYAVEFEYLHIIKMLLKSKANINGSTYLKDSIHHLNAWEIANHTGNKEILDYLVSQGAQPHPNRSSKNYKVVVRENSKVDCSVTDGMLSKIRKERREKDEEREALKEPDTLLGKLFEPKEKKEKRQAIKDRIEAEKRKSREQVRKIVEEEEEKKKKQRVIKWKWGEDPFKLRGESIQYDTPCQAHTYFMDIVGYSKKTTAEQKKCTDELIDYVKATHGYKQADRQGKLIILPTGDGMALVFFNSINAAFKCMVDVGRMTHKHSRIGLRNGLYSGPVVPVKDINDNPNVSGAGINMAQRCMDAGDNDHLLISNDVHQYVCEMDIPGLQFDDWGPVIVKHGTTVHMWTAYGRNFGRKEFPHWRGVKRLEYKEEEK